MIRLVKKSDIDDLAVIYKDLYDNVDIGEHWTIEKATELLLYWYEKQKDLFFVAVEENTIAGAIVSGVKNWFDGLRLVDTEIFVSYKFQNKHIAKNLMLEHLREAKIKYNANVIEFHTYGKQDEFPQNWYNRIGFKKDEELIIMNANIEEVLINLGYVSNNEIKEDAKETINFSYKDLIKLYNDLNQGDKAFVFDMLPEYAYLDNELEKEYIESRINAMKNCVEYNLFIIGEKDKLESLKTNKLFNYTLDSCYSKSTIYIIEKDKLKEKCLNEFFQLANGLYYGERTNGEKEVFRDLWSSNDNIGLMIKNKDIVDFISDTVSNITNKIASGEIKVETIIKGK